MQIPVPVLDDLCMRFTDNIPESEKNDPIRVCFQIEQAHWFYVDYYCEKKHYPNCPALNFQSFTKQLINRSESLSKYRNHVDRIIEQFRSYKAFIPTYGAIMFDSTLTKILLVQGYFSSKNSWGFPKGKVNEDEDPKLCAIREVLEETGYDISQKLVPDGVFSYVMNDSKVFLYVATDVDRDFAFHPHLRKEIRKIAWFNISDLPRNKTDFESCTIQGFRPNNFYGVLPAVDFIRKFSAEQLKARQFSQKKKLSAFQPVIPKAQTRQLPTLPQGFSACALENYLLNESCSPSSSGLNASSSSNFMPYNELQSVNPLGVSSPNSSHGSTSNSNLFSSFRLDNNTTPKSTRPQTLVSSSRPSPGYNTESGNVLKSLLKTPTVSQIPPTLYATTEISTVMQDIGIIGEGSRKSSRHSQDIKHPIPIQSSSILNQNSMGNLSFNPTPNSSFVNIANLSSNTLQSQFGIGSDRSVGSERDFSVSPHSPDLNFSTPPLLLPSDLLASSPATNEALSNQAYLEAYKLLAKSPFASKKRQRVERRSAKMKYPEDKPETSSASALSPQYTKSPYFSIISPEPSNVSELLSNMFSMAKSTGGIIKAKDVEIEYNRHLKPVLHAEIEESLGDHKTTAATCEITIDKYALSGTDSAESDKKLYETVYDNGQSDASSEENPTAPIFDIASNEDSDKEEIIDRLLETPTLHNGNGIRVGPLELCRAWENFKLDLSKTTLSSLFN